jgi:hypothetical protein
VRCSQRACPEAIVLLTLTKAPNPGSVPRGSTKRIRNERPQNTLLTCCDEHSDYPPQEAIGTHLSPSPIRPRSDMILTTCGPSNAGRPSKITVPGPSTTGVPPTTSTTLVPPTTN